MTSDRKKPTAGFWITVALVAVLVGYPLSIGPACWISQTLPPVYLPAGWHIVIPVAPPERMCVLEKR